MGGTPQYKTKKNAVVTAKLDGGIFFECIVFSFECVDAKHYN